MTIEQPMNLSISAQVESVESITLATFVLERDGDALSCTHDDSHIVLRQPLSAP